MELDRSRCAAWKLTPGDVSVRAGLAFSLDMTTLFHRIGRHNLDAFDRDALRRFAPISVRPLYRRCVADFVEHIETLNYFSKRGVLVIKTMGWREANKELATRGVGLILPCH
jgi:hypothetical protein